MISDLFIHYYTVMVITNAQCQSRKSLSFRSAHAHTLLAACREFATVTTSGNGVGWM